jgi:CRP-like cAMP-binding protein
MEINEVFFKKGTYIFIVGDKPDYFYIIKKGSVKVIFKSIPDVVYREGEFFGEFSILTESARAGSAIALEDTLLKKIHKSYFYSFLNSVPEVLYKVINRYCSYIEKIDNYFGGETLKSTDSSLKEEMTELEASPQYSFKEALELFFDSKYEDAAFIMKQIADSDSDKKWQAKAYLALCYLKIGKDHDFCVDMLNEVINRAPTPSEKELAKSILDKLK